MDFKKKLQKREDTDPVLTEGDEEFFNNVVLKRVEANAAQREANKKPARKVWAGVFAAATALAAVVITVSVVFVNRGPSPVYYQDENIVHVESTFEELQKDLKYLDVSETISNCNIDKSYDSASSDILYYQVKGVIGLAEIDFTIVTNENYNYEFTIENETTKQLESYSVTYASNPVNNDLTGIPKVNYRGRIKVETETTYFEYRQLLMMGDDAFFEGIQNIIKVK